MRKQEFLSKLKMKLSVIPKQDVEERLNFYSEMIDDRMEDGRTEDEAVSEIGSVDEIAAQIISEIPHYKLAKEKTKQKSKIKAWEIVLLALGSPIWLSLLIASFAVILSLYIVLLSLIISIWAVFVSLVACTFGGMAASVVFICQGNGFVEIVGIAMIGASIVCAGLSIFLFFGCKAATKGTLLLTKKIALGIKNVLLKRRTHNE